MAWTRETEWPGNYLFHYTEAAYVEEIAADGYFLVGPGANFGLGLYATDLAPHEATPDEIRAVCFEGDASFGSFDGVLVLLGDDSRHRFVEVDRRVFLLPAEQGIGELIPLQRILIATGIRHPDGLWRMRNWA